MSVEHSCLVSKRQKSLLSVKGCANNDFMSRIRFKELKGVLHTVPEIVELVGATNTNLVLQTNDQDGEEKA